MNTNIFNRSGALTDLFNKLNDMSIHEFKSLEEIFEYKRNYKIKIDEIKQNKKDEINEDIKLLNVENENLLSEYNKCKDHNILIISEKIEKYNNIINNVKNNLFYIIKKHYSKRKLIKIELKYNDIIEKPLVNYLNKINENRNKIDYLSNYQDEEIEKRAKLAIKKIENTVSKLNSLSPLIFGSVGETKAIKLFQEFPNKYYIINDFRETFRPPLYNRNENDYIYSVQLDHIVIGPTGVYLIETKYWNKKSIESKDLFSPVKQIRRGSFALFVLLNDYIRGTSLFSSNWGTKKLSIFSIILMMNTSINEQLQYVKILTEYDLIDYITKRPNILNDEQIKYLVKILK